MSLGGILGAFNLDLESDSTPVSCKAGPAHYLSLWEITDNNYKRLVWLLHGTN